uniref:C3H1-type domain-containing protein n=1 Tax=viral metagenome TaxID=1070528 RepID=A0A6C0EDV1_9ZZZZ
MAPRTTNSCWECNCTNECGFRDRVNPPRLTPLCRYNKSCNILACKYAHSTPTGQSPSRFINHVPTKSALCRHMWTMYEENGQAYISPNTSCKHGNACAFHHTLDVHQTALYEKHKKMELLMSMQG